MMYEVVCTQSYLDVGLLIATNRNLEPRRVLARSSTYSSEPEYGGVDTLTWVHTDVYLTKDEWKKISCDKPTDQILKELRIKKKVPATNDKEIEYDCILCKNGTYRKSIYLHDGTFVRKVNFCDECGRDLRHL